MDQNREKIIHNDYISPTHALIVQTDFCSDLDFFLKQYFKKIIRTGGGFDTDFYCNKIDSNNYLDLIEINDEIIKKETIINLQNQFATTGIEALGYKFCVLKNFERANSSAFNSFLKFLEEPSSKTYFVLTTANINLLPETIISRCQKVRLFTDLEKLNDLINEFNNDQEFIKWIMHSFNDINSLKEFLQSENKKEIQDWIKIFINHDFNMVKNQLDIFKKWDYSTIKFILNILKQVGSHHFKYQVIKLLNDLIFNPSKPLVFFQLWEEWSE